MTDKPKVTQAAAVQWPQSRRKPVSYVSAYLADEADEQSQDDGSEMMTDKLKVTQADRERFNWQKAAGLKYPPTDLTIQYRKAVEGYEAHKFLSLGYQWIDKPHRLIFDLCNHIERIAAEQSRDDVIEECAKVVERFVDPHAAAMKQHQARAIAFALRNLKGKKS